MKRQIYCSHKGTCKFANVDCCQQEPLPALLASDGVAALSTSGFLLTVQDSALPTGQQSAQLRSSGLRYLSARHESSQQDDDALRMTASKGKGRVFWS